MPELELVVTAVGSKENTIVLKSERTSCSYEDEVAKVVVRSSSFLFHASLFSCRPPSLVVKISRK